MCVCVWGGGGGGAYGRLTVPEGSDFNIALLTTIKV